MNLIVCEGCQRHVKASDVSCPFCGAERLASLAPPSPDADLRGQSRAKRFALQAAALATAAACGAGTLPPNPDASTAGADASSEASSGSDASAGGDASPPADGSAPQDTGVDTGTICCPPYGCVFPGACGRESVRV
jgi:hypothetical protein